MENWNEERKEQAQERSYLQALVRDVQTDTARFGRDIRRAEFEEARGRAILQFIVDEHPSIPDPTELGLSLDGVGRFVPAPYATSTYTDLVTTGDIHLLRNEEVRRALVEYYSRIAGLERFAELYRERLWDGYLSHVVAVMPMTAQIAILRGDSVEFTEIQVRRMLADLRSRPAFEFNLKNAIRSYILLHRQQTNGLTAALALLELLEGELS